MNFRSALQEAGFLLKQCVVWVKNTFTPGRQDYNWQEPILYGQEPGAAHKWFGEMNYPGANCGELDPRLRIKGDLQAWTE